MNTSLEFRYGGLQRLLNAWRVCDDAGDIFMFGHAAPLSGAHPDTLELLHDVHIVGVDGLGQHLAELTVPRMLCSDHCPR